MLMKVFLCAVFFALLLLLSGCIQKVPGTPNTPYDKDASPEVTGNVNLPDSQLLDCDWTLHVDQTIPVTVDGLTVEYTLVLIAQKAGGTDVNGTYEGAAYIGAKLDISSISNEVIAAFGGFDMNVFANNIVFDVVPYDIEEYSDYGVPQGEIGISPLIEYESMALLSPEMTGGGVLNPSVFGIQGEHMEYHDAASGTQAVPMKIAIMSGSVSVSVPSFKIGHSFEGTVLGDPQPGQYQQAIARIEELIEQSEEEPGDGASGGFDFGDLIGQFIGE